MKSSILGRQVRVLLLAAAVSVLSACGGGGGRVEAFEPTRIVTFGDESSLITSQGKKYTVNGLDSVTNLTNCGLNPIWVQILAGHFGLVYPQCNLDNVAVPSGQMRAAAGAKVADVATQIDQFLSVNTFSRRDLVTVLVGANDVLELYNSFPAQSVDALAVEAQSRGRLLGLQVNRIANAGGRVIISTLPDMGTLPFAYKEKNSKFDTDRAAVLSRLSNEFNVAMRLALINDGRMIGLLLLDEVSQQDARYPALRAYSNVTEASCLSTVTILNCTTATLVTGASSSSYLWANDYLYGPAGQQNLGSLAITRAVNNPF